MDKKDFAAKKVPIYVPIKGKINILAIGALTLSVLPKKDLIGFSNLNHMKTGIQSVLPVSIL